MPTSAELIDFQYDFEEPRGLLEHNKGARGVSRMLDEVAEAVTELEDGNLNEMIGEVIDVVIFAHSILGWLARETGIPYDGIDRMIEQKMECNHQKYRVELFSQYPVEEAIKIAREEWNKNQRVGASRSLVAG